MEVGKLTVQRRHESGKGIARKLRAKGVVPGVCYGHEMDAPIPISVDVRELRGSLDPAKRGNTVIEMNIEDNGEVERTVTVMIREHQLHKIRREIMHVDLVAIDKDAEVIAETPVEFEGRPKGLVVGGLIHVVRRSIEVRCKPADIPTRIVAEISELDVNDVIHVSDLTLPENVEAHSPGYYALITCSAGEVETEEEEEVEVEEAAAVAPAAS